jgi:hypothetical protein
MGRCTQYNILWAKHLSSLPLSYAYMAQPAPLGKRLGYAKWLMASALATPRVPPGVGTG